VTFVSGHGETGLLRRAADGELGFLDSPDYYLGMPGMQERCAARVIVDIGMPGAGDPARRGVPSGETWSHDRRGFIIRETGINEEMVRSEVLRYLGWPAQAISYKVGERHWLAARDEAKRRDGASFDLKRFHTEALALGPMGLDQLRRELAAR
jgi:uncharacterized protein (DUF885 family)